MEGLQQRAREFPKKSDDWDRLVKSHSGFVPTPIPQNANAPLLLSRGALVRLIDEPPSTETLVGWGREL